MTIFGTWLTDSTERGRRSSSLDILKFDDIFACYPNANCSKSVFENTFTAVDNTLLC
jgi:hypothetical protein